MKKYIAQPQYGTGTVNVYDITPGSTPQLLRALTPNADIQALTAATVAAPNAGGLNSVLVYQDFSGQSMPQQCLLLAYTSPSDDNGVNLTPGAVYVFDLDAILKSGSGVLPAAAAATLPLVGPASSNFVPVGMAIQPGTGDLYVAAPSAQAAEGGNPAVMIFSKTPGGSWSSTGDTGTFNYNTLGGFSTYPSNFAFDLHGFLWMSSFGSDSGVPYNFLTCFMGVPSATPPSPSFWFANDDGDGNGTALNVTPLVTNPATPPPSATLQYYGLSSPEGIAFDPAGNLWIANNNEEYIGSDVNPKNENSGGGSLTRISASYLLSLLFPAEPADSTQILLSDIPSDSIAVYYINEQSQPGGLFFDGYTLYINDENNYDDSGNPIVWQMQVNPDGTPASTLTQASGVVETTNPGNGTMAVFDYSPTATTSVSALQTPAQLLIKDWSSSTGQDNGAEPDNITSPQVAWESPDIGVFQSAQAGLSASSALGSEIDWSMLPAGADGNPEAYLYVRVTNISSSASLGSEVLKAYWAHASTALQWPDPWDGLLADTSASNPSHAQLGGFIAAVTIPAIQPGDVAIVPLVWSDVPQPLAYTDEDGNLTLQDHFCLLARIESNGLYPFGMTYPEQWNFSPDEVLLPTQATLGTNVLQNRGIGWRNVQIVQSGVFDPNREIKINVLGANYGAIEKLVGFQLQTLGRDGKPQPISGRTTVVARGSALERLLEFERELIERKEFEHLGEGRFKLSNLERGMKQIRLRPGETLPFTVEFAPEERVENFALRVIQVGESDGRAEIVGGQTFVVGEVEGFSGRRR